MQNLWIDPTAEQQAQAELVATDVCELLNRLGHEGIDRRVILMGLAAAACDLVTCAFGNTAVPGWFTGQAVIAQQMLRDGA